jgi:uncharacterized membrane protein YkoI
MKNEDKKMIPRASLDIERRILMKTQTHTIVFLSLGLAAFWLSSVGVASTETLQGKVDPLAAEAKITRSEAEQTALKKAPNGTVKEGELEKEGGRLIWSFDIATSGTKDITEVQVDAKTGKVVSTTTETPTKEAHEAAAEAKAIGKSPSPAKGANTKK